MTEGLNGFEFTEYARRPFVVQALMVTVDNMDIIAPYVGEIQVKEDGTRYIQVDRRKVPNVFRVWPGFYLTRMDDNVRCYSAKVFAEQFVKLEGDAEVFVAKLNGEGDV